MTQTTTTISTPTTLIGEQIRYWHSTYHEAYPWIHIQHPTSAVYLLSSPHEEYLCRLLVNGRIGFDEQIWQEKCPVIVMLTNLEEKNRVKADQYWPDGRRKAVDILETDFPELIGKIEVTMDWVKSRKGFKVRKFTLRKRSKAEWLNEDRIVYQLHYTEWPDFGAPGNAIL